MKNKMKKIVKVKKVFLSLRERCIQNFEEKAKTRVHCFTNGFRYRYSGNEFERKRACKPHQYTHAGLFHHDPVVLRIAGLTSYQAHRMLWREVNQMAIDKMLLKR